MTPDEYQQAIRELARTAKMADDAAARMEAALGQAFESCDAGSHDRAVRRLSFRALAAAAALVIAVGAGAWYARRQPVTLNNVTSTSPPTTSKAGLKAGPSEKAGLKASATDKAAVNVDSRSRGADLQVGRTSARKLPPVIRPQGFVAVPAAAALPQFESGVIVRMSLPVTALPSYGVDISPASSDAPVEADVLVGQDGRARAIRLVNTSRSQQ